MGCGNHLHAPLNSSAACCPTRKVPQRCTLKLFHVSAQCVRSTMVIGSESHAMTACTHPTSFLLVAHSIITVSPVCLKAVKPVHPIEDIQKHLGDSGRCSRINTSQPSMFMPVSFLCLRVNPGRVHDLPCQPGGP